MSKLYTLLLVGWCLVSNLVSPAQQIVCERLLTTPGLQVRFPTACMAPNGEFIVMGAAQPVGTATPMLATHTFVARLQAAGCDTMWQRLLPHSTAYYTSSDVLADVRGIWLLTLDTVNANNTPLPFKGTRLWRLNSDGRVRRVVRFTSPTVRETPNFLLPDADGGGYAQVYNQVPQVGTPRAPGLFRFDSTGTLRWRRDYGYAAGYYGGNLCYTPTGHVLLTGMVAVGANYEGHAKLLEVETNRGDSLRGVNLPWGPNVTYESVVRRNDQPLDAIALRGGGGYVLPSVVNAPTIQTGQLTRLDANYNVLWRYQLPRYGASSDFLQFTQVRELADGTLLALVRPFLAGRAFWLYRFNTATGALLNVYPFTSAFGAFQVFPAHLLPVAADSTLLVVGGSRLANTTQVGGIYVARLRVPGLPRVVMPTLPLAARAGTGTMSEAFGLYPNPATDAVTVDLPARPGPGYLELRDGLGRLVRGQAVGAAAQAVRWPLTGLVPGLYAVVLRGPGGVGVRRLVMN